MTIEQYQFTGEPTTDLAKHLRLAFEQAKLDYGKLAPEVLSMAGMSGRKYRYLINRLAEAPDARYLEVGSCAGSTLVSALYGNKIKATAIDNWSLFDGPSDQFFTNVGKFIGKNRVSVLTSDFREVDYRSVGKHNIYLFDGPHEKQDQYDGLLYALPALDDEFAFIVDDWNWEFVSEGTFEAISHAQCEILYSIEIFSTDSRVHPANLGLPSNQDSDWHNGYFLGILRKKS